jgi:hypothetical protein
MLSEILKALEPTQKISNFFKNIQNSRLLTSASKNHQETSRPLIRAGKSKNIVRNILYN